MARPHHLLADPLQVARRPPPGWCGTHVAGGHCAWGACRVDRRCRPDLGRSGVRWPRPWVDQVRQMSGAARPLQDLPVYIAGPGGSGAELAIQLGQAVALVVQRGRLPLAHAMRALADAIDGPLALPLFLQANPNGYAAPLPAGHVVKSGHQAKAPHPMSRARAQEWRHPGQVAPLLSSLAPRPVAPPRGQASWVGPAGVAQALRWCAERGDGLGRLCAHPLEHIYLRTADVERQLATVPAVADLAPSAPAPAAANMASAEPAAVAGRVAIGPVDVADSGRRLSLADLPERKPTGPSDLKTCRAVLQVWQDLGGHSYGSGASTKIAAHYGVTPRAVHGWINSAKPQTKPQRRNKSLATGATRDPAKGPGKAHMDKWLRSSKRAAK